MKREKLFFVSALSMMLAFSSACSDEMVGHEAPPEADAPAVSDANTLELTSDEMTILRTMDGSSPKISQDEAISIAAKFLGQNQLSKSTSGVRCDVVTRKRSSISKSGTSETDTLMYILNYGNNDGYAMVCADVRVPEQILAYAETGSMDTETDNPGVKLFLDMAQDYMDIQIAEIESKRDSLEEVIQGKIAEVSEYQGKHLSKSRVQLGTKSTTIYDCRYTDITSQIDPLLRTYWRQESPYNNKTPLDVNDKGDSVHSLAGCVAIATSQLIAYWQYPKSINGVSMQWKSMYFNNQKDENKERAYSNYRLQVSTLVEYVGKKIGTEYHYDRSSAKTENAVNLLSTLGYSTNCLVPYSETSIVNSLNNKRPLLIEGYRKTKEGKIKGHCWLIDGYVEETTEHKSMIMYETQYREDDWSITKDVIINNSEYNTISCYFHCNWGWDGNWNGFFLSHTFKNNLRYKISSNKSSMEEDFGEDSDPYYYKYNLRIAPNIHR